MDKKYRRKILGRKKRDESPHGGFEIIYTGFILITLCFFILLTSFSTFEASHLMQFVHSFSDAVSILNGGLKIGGGKSILMPAPDIVSKHHHLADLLRRVAEISKESELYGIELALTSKGVVMTLHDKMVFKTASAEIMPSAMHPLRKIAHIISIIRYPVRIEGHTDNVPIATKEYPSNWELSTARAVNVLRYLTEIEKLDISKLSAAGFSEFHPVGSNDSDQGRSRNRRVEIVFLEDGK